MTVYGTIAEYNPFHSGHKYLLDRMHINSEDSVVVVMSGNFVQRAEPACMLTSSRCEAALRNGADLIIQLPLPWSVSGAQNFARGSVSLLKATNIVDTLCFGSENGNISALLNIAQCLRDEETVKLMKNYLSTGISFANARQRAVKDNYPGLAPILDNPNDNLGIEYLNAMLELDATMSPMCIKRYGAGHDSNDIGATASGKMLRKLMQAGEDVSPYMPKTAYEVYARDRELRRISGGMAAIENTVLYKLRTTTAKEISVCPDVSEGIENCIVNAARDARTIDELYSIAKSKRYSHARIRRIVMSAFLGIVAEDCTGLPPYIKVLGFNERGRELMRDLREKADLPIITKYSDSKKLDERGKRIYDLECKAADIYALSFWPALPCGTEQRQRPVKLRSDSPVEMPADETEHPAPKENEEIDDEDSIFEEKERKPEKRERRLFGRNRNND